MASTVHEIPEGYLSEIIGYTQPWIVSPGAEVAIKVSSTEKEYKHRVVRLIQGLDGPHAPEVRVAEIPEIASGVSSGRFQKAFPGSYALVENIDLTTSAEGISISLFFQPFLLNAGHDQALFSLVHDAAFSGLSVILGDQGHLRLLVGNGEKFQQIPVDYKIVEKQWIKLDVVAHQSSLTVTANPVVHLGQRVGRKHESSVNLAGKLALPTFGRLTLAATQAESNVPATNFFNGRLEAVSISTLGSDPRDIAKFDFRVNLSTDSITDVSGYGNHGILINAPTRAVKGHDWDGSETDWSKALYGYGAIHFHEDELDDANWDTDFVIRLPEDARSGAYAVLVETTGDQPVKDEIVFFVRPKPAVSKSSTKLALVLSTFTYTAYANEHMYDETKSSHLAPSGNFKPRPADEHFRRMQRRSDLGLSLYDVHRDGTGSVFSSTKRPILNVRPDFEHWALDRPREFSADLLMIGFLEHLGIPYDVLTDHDLDAFGTRATEQYSTLITGSHPEYPSTKSLDTYTAFASRGGSILYLGGNGFYWRSVVDPANPHRLEVRRGDQGVRTFGLPGGERNHSLDSAQGGLWRSIGRAANYLVAVGCCGEGVGPGVPYGRTAAGRDERYKWVFDGLGEDELVGEYGFGGGASGDEIDRWDPQYGSPTSAVVIASSTGHPDEFVLFPEDLGFQQTNIIGTQTDMIRSDMVLYEGPGGGWVFSIGSMNWYNSLGWDGYKNSVATVTGNVIRRFLGIS